MDNISSWVRQARHRAKKHDVASSLTTAEATAVLVDHSHTCAYCPQPAITLDHVMPLAEGGPNVPANVVPVCRHCKFVKRNRSVVWLHEQGILESKSYMALIAKLLSRHGAAELRSVLRQAVGLIEEVSDG